MEKTTGWTLTAKASCFHCCRLAGVISAEAVPTVGAPSFSAWICTRRSYAFSLWTALPLARFSSFGTYLDSALPMMALLGGGGGEVGSSEGGGRMGGGVERSGVQAGGWLEERAGRCARTGRLYADRGMLCHEGLLSVRHRASAAVSAGSAPDTARPLISQRAAGEPQPARRRPGRRR